MELGDADFEALREIIRVRFGIVYDDGKRALLCNRLTPRVAKAGVADFGAYTTYLRADARREIEFAELASILTNNETYFFRERAQLSLLCGPVLDDLLAHGSGAESTLHVWSAACSTGEEPFSIAMSLLDSGRIRDDHFAIRATDVSPRVLGFAERAIYRSISFRASDPALMRRYFHEVGDEFELAERVKRHVLFSVLNLMDDDAIARLGPFDVIFCRNALIYFDKPTQKHVVESLARALRPEGYLFLGHSESLFHVSDLYEPVVAPEAIAYRLRAKVGVR